MAFNKSLGIRVSIIAVAVACIAVGFWFTNVKKSEGVIEESAKVGVASQKKSAIEKRRNARKKTLQNKKSDKRTKTEVKRPVRKVSAEPEITDALDEASSNEDVAGVLREAQALLNANPDSDTRSHIAFTLADIGVPGMDLLFKMMKDPDSDVASEARGYWLQQVTLKDNMENDDPKATGELLVAGVEALGEDLSTDGFSEFVDAAWMLESPHDKAAIIALINSTDPNNKERLELLSEAVNSFTDTESKDKDELLKISVDSYNEELAEMQEIEDDQNVE